MTTIRFAELEAKMDPRHVAQARRKADRILAGMFLTEMRRRSGLTQAQLARKLGIRQPAISRMEKQDDLQLSTLLRIIEVLGGRLKMSVELPGGIVDLRCPPTRRRRAA